MDIERYVEALVDDGAGLIDACGRSGPSVLVDACPGWTAVDLMWHVAEVHGFFATVVERRARSIDGIDRPLRPLDDARIGAASREQLDRLVAALGATPAETEVWCFGARPVVAVARRTAHETAIHRFDAERAAGRDWQPDAALASDGIDEFLDVFARRPHRDAAPVGGSVHLHCTDVEGEWMLRPGDDGVVVTREHAKGDCAIRGRAADLLLVLWRRQPLSTVEVIGDADVARRFVDAPRL